MKLELVISAFERDYSWVENIDKNVKLTIYRKGIDQNNENEIFLPLNVGRCVHTFFNHIYKNYYNLSDYTFFSQDSPFDHWENIIQTINGGVDSVVKNASLKFDGYFGFCNEQGSGWELVDGNHFKEGKVLKSLSDGRPHDYGLEVDRFWDILFDEPRPELYEFTPGGHFGITKENVHFRSLEFYKKIVELLETEYRAAWCFERMECYIFNKNYKSKI
jgi:hypothetical protein